jgi:hypothetical protein
MPEKIRNPDGTEHVELKKNEARQGLELYEMRYVLILGTAGAIVALTALYFFFYYFR